MELGHPNNLRLEVMHSMIRLSEKRVGIAFVLALVALLAFQVTTFAATTDSLTIYSGRQEPLVGPLFQQFEAETGIKINVRYGDTTELAATILEEGRNSPADIFFAQDAGALGALAYEERLAPLPQELANLVDTRLRSADNLWVGTSGRARVIVYNTKVFDEDELPTSIWDYTKPEWRGRLGWSPTNGSFQAFVTALRFLEGDARAEQWLRGIRANLPRSYHNNTAIYDAVARGEIDIGFTNHYYLFRFLAEQGEGFPARIYFTEGDAGSMINIAGVGIVKTSTKREAAEQFIRFLLSDAAQEHFASANYEYPVTGHVEAHPLLPALEEIETPDMDLSHLEDLQGTLELMQKVGVI